MPEPNFDCISVRVREMESISTAFDDLIAKDRCVWTDITVGCKDIKRDNTAGNL